MIRSRSVVLSSLLSLLAACSGPTPAPSDAGPPAPAAEPAAKVASPEAERAYAQALELEAAGRYEEARVAVEQAIAGGAGRNAQLLAAKLAILRDDLDAAARLLEPLAASGADAPALFNLGLVAQKRNQYNAARSRYLAALKADPTLHQARYNLALLTAQAGATEEARHHATKFIELVPNDPLAAELRLRILADPPPAGTPPAEPTPPAEKR